MARGFGMQATLYGKTIAYEGGEIKMASGLSVLAEKDDLHLAGNMPAAPRTVLSIRSFSFERLQ